MMYGSSSWALGVLAVGGLVSCASPVQSDILPRLTCPAPITVFVTIAPPPPPTVVLYRTVVKTVVKTVTKGSPTEGPVGAGDASTCTTKTPKATVTVVLDSLTPPTGGSHYRGPRPWASSFAPRPSSNAGTKGSGGQSQAPSIDHDLPRYPNAGNPSGEGNVDGKPPVGNNGQGNLDLPGAQRPPNSYNAGSEEASMADPVLPNEIATPSNGNVAGNSSPQDGPYGPSNNDPLGSGSSDPSSGQNHGNAGASPGNPQPPAPEAQDAPCPDVSPTPVPASNKGGNPSDVVIYIIQNEGEGGIGEGNPAGLGDPAGTSYPTGGAQGGVGSPPDGPAGLPYPASGAGNSPGAIGPGIGGPSGAGFHDGSSPNAVSSGTRGQSSQSGYGSRLDSGAPASGPIRGGGTSSPLADAGNAYPAPVAPQPGQGGSSGPGPSNMDQPVGAGGQIGGLPDGRVQTATISYPQPPANQAPGPVGNGAIGGDGSRPVVTKTIVVPYPGPVPTNGASGSGLNSGPGASGNIIYSILNGASGANQGNGGNAGAGGAKSPVYNLPFDPNDGNKATSGSGAGNGPIYDLGSGLSAGNGDTSGSGSNAGAQNGALYHGGSDPNLGGGFGTGSQGQGAPGNGGNIVIPYPIRSSGGNNGNNQLPAPGQTPCTTTLGPGYPVVAPLPPQPLAGQGVVVANPDPAGPPLSFVLPTQGAQKMRLRRQLPSDVPAPAAPTDAGPPLSVETGTSPTDLSAVPSAVAGVSASISLPESLGASALPTGVVANATDALQSAVDDASGGLPMNATGIVDTVVSGLPTSLPGNNISTPVLSIIANLTSDVAIPFITSPPAPTSAFLNTSAPVQTPATNASSGVGISPGCGGVGDVGDITLDFEDADTGILYNPYRRFWFSQGFIVEATTSKLFRPSSGDKFVEFVPASLSNGRFRGSNDWAMIGMGRENSNPCFRFNLHSMRLGCDARTPDQNCRFEVWGLRYNPLSGREELMGSHEISQTLACTQTQCDLAQKNFTGYSDISSILVQAHSSNRIRVWWLDDLQVSWANNTCEAAACRTFVPQRMLRREVGEARRELWHWNLKGLKLVEAK